MFDGIKTRLREGRNSLSNNSQLGFWDSATTSKKDGSQSKAQIPRSAVVPSRLPRIPDNHPLRGSLIKTTTDLERSPSLGDTYRHRKQFGVNLGAWFVGEKWIADKLYSETPQGLTSELSAVSSHVNKYGLDATQAVWEEHWRTWVTTDDITLLATHGVNAVRIPIGWFSLSDPSLLRGTEFEPFERIYSNCWEQFVMPFIRCCATENIGVLLDLHCVPGGQNADAHSGTDDSNCRLFSDPKAREMTLRSIKALIDRAAVLENVIGVQAMNEPAYGQEEFLMPLYEECLIFAHARGGVPLYIGDNWNMAHWTTWAGQRNEFCVVDHHYYYCFTDNDRALSPRQHIDRLKNSNELAKCSQNARGNIVIGEWSLAMSAESKQRTRVYDGESSQKEFGHSQLDKYTVNSGGSFFWTYKFQIRNHENEWDLRDMMQRGSLPRSLSKRISVPQSGLKDMFERQIDVHFSEHCKYWNTKGKTFEHWRFEEGFRLGWDDALAFAVSGSFIGFLGEWKRKRTNAHALDKGFSDCLWEFEHGFETGVKSFEICCK